MTSHANKIELNGEILLDLTQDTATEADVAEGKTFHRADGVIATGTMVAGGGSTEKVILAEQAYEGFALNSFYGAYLKSIVPSPFELVEGQEYKILWDDVEYTRTAFAFTNAADSTSCIAVGNKMVSTGENDGDLFAIVNDTTNNYTHLFSLENKADHSVGIYQKNSAVKTQEKTVDITANGEMEILPDEGYALSKVIANVFVSGSGGEWLYAEGDVTPAEDGSVTVTHGLGVMPDIIMVMKNTGQITSTNSKNYVINGLYLSEKLLGAGQESYGTAFMYTPSSKYFMVGGAAIGLEHITPSYYGACCDVTSQTMKLGTNLTPLFGGSPYSWCVYAKK